MAVTKIWPVKGRLDSVLHYAENEEKTRAPDLTGLKNDLEDVLHYAVNDAKTSRESQLFVSGVNCVPEIARQQMELTKQQFGKTGGTVAFHAYQSFCPGEVTPEQCHAIGVELAKRLWGERFQVLVATHLNTDCCHNHFVINSVSFADGKRYNDCKSTYRALQDASDQLCREQGLSVVENRTAHHTPRSIYQAEKNGEPTRYNVMRQDIDRAILRCFSLRELPTVLQKMGYEVDFNPHRKYATIKLPGDKHPTRFKTLGEDYTEAALRQRIAELHRLSLPERTELLREFHPNSSHHHGKPPKGIWDILMASSDLFRTYRYYCYLLGHWPNKNSRPHPPHPAMWEDYRRWEQIEQELHLMEKFSLDTIDAVEGFVSEQERHLEELTARRTHCRNLLRRCTDPQTAAALREEKDVLTREITVIRKNIRIAKRIPDRTTRMQKNLELLENRDYRSRSDGRNIR